MLRLASPYALCLCMSHKFPVGRTREIRCKPLSPACRLTWAFCRVSAEMFLVQVVALTAAQDEASVSCEEQVSKEGVPCTHCGKMTVCFTGAENGPCQVCRLHHLFPGCARGEPDVETTQYTYTPYSAGFIKISVALNSPQGPLQIQGSPFRAHVDDGAARGPHRPSLRQSVLLVPPTPLPCISKFF